MMPFHLTLLGEWMAVKSPWSSGHRRKGTRLLQHHPTVTLAVKTIIDRISKEAAWWRMLSSEISDLVNWGCAHNRFTINIWSIVFCCFSIHQAKPFLKVQYSLSLGHNKLIHKWLVYDTKCKPVEIPRQAIEILQTDLHASGYCNELHVQSSNSHGRHVHRETRKTGPCAQQTCTFFLPGVTLQQSIFYGGKPIRSGTGVSITM